MSITAFKRIDLRLDESSVPSISTKGIRLQADRPASPYDVRACYRQFLGRDAESEQVVAGHLSDTPSLWTLIARFLAAPETQRRGMHAACERIERDQSGLGVVLDLTDAEEAEMTRHIEAIWSRYGAEEAYFSVLTNPAYLSNRLEDDVKEQFYNTGASEVASLQEVFRRNGVDIDSNWSVVELGCGVGRMAEAFSDLFESYAGVDISANHLAIARNRLTARGRHNARFLLLNDYLSGGESFDVFYSIIVLQHNPPPVIHRLLDESLGKVRSGGYAFFQVPCFLYDYTFEAQAYLAGAGRADHMEMHALPQHKVFELLSRHGMVPIEVAPSGHIGGIGLSYTFFAKKAV